MNLKRSDQQPLSPLFCCICIFFLLQMSFFWSIFLVRCVKACIWIWCDVRQLSRKKRMNQFFLCFILSTGLRCACQIFKFYMISCSPIVMTWFFFFSFIFISNVDILLLTHTRICTYFLKKTSFLLYVPILLWAWEFSCRLLIFSIKRWKKRIKV